MKLNENIILSGSKCQLVPYTRELVETYHQWFVDHPELLSATGSELLSLDEEYANQESWRTDESKLTFLIRDTSESSSPVCGDVNCFFSDYFYEDFHDSDGEGEWNPEGLLGEINLMVARKKSRRKGIAEDALVRFMQYIQTEIPTVKLFVAKIQDTNIASIALFEKLGFHEFKRVECFNEVHYIKWC
jgi:RimJ/RimL family protein N-acetyltransferase